MSSAADFFDDVYAAYQQAAARAGVTECAYRFDTHTIQLRFAGGALIPAITPALEHLRVPTVDPAALTIYLWDVTSTDCPLPRCPWDWGDNPARGDVLSMSDDRFMVAYNQFGRMLSMLDHHQNAALWSVADVAESGRYLNATPLLDILHWWLQPRGLQTVHSAAIGRTSGGLLLAGKGGSGKSTTSLACLSSRLGFAGDDYCVVGTSADPTVHSLYNSARIEFENLSRLPHLRPLVTNHAGPHGVDEKATVFLQQHCPEKLIKRFPLRAVLLPHVTNDSRSRLSPTSSMEGFKALVISTISQRAGAGRGAFEGMARAVKQLPCYSLALGSDLQHLADLLDELAVRLA